MVITDRLGKGVILEPMRTIEAKDVARIFLRTFTANTDYQQQ